MPAPDVFAQLAIGTRECPDQESLQEVQNAALSFLPLGNSAKALVVCVNQVTRPTRAIKVGIWADPGNVQEEELRNSLYEWDEVATGNGPSAALSVSTSAIQHMASAQWPLIAKNKIEAPVGFVRLDKTIRIRTEPGRIIGQVNGTWKKRWIRNIRFTLTTTEKLRVSGVQEQPVEVNESSSDIDAQRAIWSTLLIAAISPAMGLLEFFATYKVERAGEASVSGIGPGAVLAVQWPSSILTKIDPPLLPGKIIFYWNEFTIGYHRIGAKGAFIPIPRDPTANIRGRTRIEVKAPRLKASETYRVHTQDMKPPLHFRWFVDGVNVGTEAGQQVRFQADKGPQTITKTVRVEVQDSDGATLSDEATVHFIVTGRYNP